MAELYFLGNTSDCQMFGCIILSGDKTVVIDGGTESDSVQLYEMIMEKSSGSVDAWFFTHPHHDHIGAFLKMCKTNPGIQIERIYHKFPSVDELKKYGARYEEEADMWMEFDRLTNTTFHGKVCHVKKDDVFAFDEIKVTVLRVYNSHIKSNFVNNSSALYRIDSPRKSILILGDLGVEGGNELAAMYGDALKCDICQLAHHGQTGVGENVYDLAAPDFCICTAPKWSWENLGRSGPGTGPFRCAETMAMPSIARATTTVVYMDGTRELELPLKY